MQDPVQVKAADLGIPDWRDASAYPAADELTLSAWRWEFLRRNPQYREDYKQPEPPPEEESKDRYFERVYKLVGAINPKLSVKEYCKCTEGELSHSVQFAAFIGTHDYSSIYAQKFEIERIFSDASFHDIYFRCDPKKPLQPQFKIFLMLAQRSQYSFKRKLLRPQRRSKKWPTYLRVLDARDCGASYIEMAKGLGLHHEDRADLAKAASDLMTAAVKMRDSWPFASVDELEAGTK